MRKALIAGIVASALFAVGAFAAVITQVNTDNVASGEGEVASCTDLAEVEFTTSTGVTPTSGATTDWTVSAATVALGADCAGATVDLAIGNNPAGSGEPTSWTDAGACNETATAGTFTCTVANAPVRPIVEVAVLANGNAIAANLAP